MSNALARASLKSQEGQVKFAKLIEHQIHGNLAVVILRFTDVLRVLSSA